MNFQEQVQQNLHVLMGNFTSNIGLIETYVRSHEAIFSPVAILITMLLLLKISRTKRKQLEKVKKEKPRTSSSTPPAAMLTNEDIKMVAGDDLITTQLDLARAYMEMGKKNLAKSILYNVVKQGHPHQQKEARQLIDSM